MQIRPRHFPRLLAGMLGIAAAPLAFARSASTTFDVTLTITAACTIDAPAATDVAFGSHPSSATDIDAAGQLNVNCTPGTGYAIALSPGLNADGGGVAARAMAGPDGILVPYQLYQDPARSTVWGETPGTDTLAGTGSGTVQAVPVYGRVPSANFPAATYTDTVTATITY